jgi:hypothetical protein
MRPGIYYLPEYHDFEHLAVVRWPHIPRHGQGDWIDSILVIEDWCNQFIGPHHSEWAYGQQQDLEYWQACVAFRQARSKTLFLLKWSE